MSPIRAVLAVVTLACAVSLLMSAGVAGQGNAASSAGKASSAEKKSTASSTSSSSSGAAAAAASPVAGGLTVAKYGSTALSADSPVLTVRVTDEVGKAVTGAVTVKGVSLTRKGEKSPTLENVAFKAVTGDSALFAYDFFAKPLPAGYYTLVVSAQKSGGSPFQTELKVNILTSVDIVNAELIISDVDVGSKTTKLNYPSTHTGTLEVDNSQRIQLRFQLKDRATGEPLTVHQAFVRFAATSTRQEIVFIAEQDSTGASYKVDLALGVRSKDFNYLSGQYAVSLIVGDALVANSVNWKLATVAITFNNGVAQKEASSAASEYVAKPEIKHIFREQEKRPHPLVSNFFTGLVMLPFFALFVMWAKIGINFSSFQLSLSAILFHTSLALIFLLYGCFFVKLNMFQTVKYLAGIGLLAYLSGHSLLSGLIKRNAAAKGKQQ